MWSNTHEILITEPLTFVWRSEGQSDFYIVPWHVNELLSYAPA